MAWCGVLWCGVCCSPVLLMVPHHPAPALVSMFPYFYGILDSTLGARVGRHPLRITYAAVGGLRPLPLFARAQLAENARRSPLAVSASGLCLCVLVLCVSFFCVCESRCFFFRARVCTLSVGVVSVMLCLCASMGCVRVCRYACAHVYVCLR